MSNRQAEMTGDFTATVNFTDKNKTSLELDFRPIIKQFALQKLSNFVLLHWQSRPQRMRGYGAYDYATRTYHCIDWNDVTIFKCSSRLLQIDESIHLSAPTAVILYNANLLKSTTNGKWMIR